MAVSALKASAAIAPGAETPAKMANDNRYTKIKAYARTLGEDKAKGEDALPKLAVAIVKAAAEGYITGVKNIKSARKDDEGNVIMLDHVGELYEEYMEKAGTKAVHERSEDSIDVQISKARKFYELGALPLVDGIVVIDKCHEFYTEVNGVKKNKLSKGAYLFYQDVAKAQCHKDNRDAILSDEAIKALMWKPEAGEKTVEGELKRALKILDDLVKGAGKQKLQDNDERTALARNLINERLAELSKSAKVAALQAQLAALNAA